MDTSDTLSGGVQRMMMDGLFGFDENMQIIPMLATSYEANDEATEYKISEDRIEIFVNGYQTK